MIRAPVKDEKEWQDGLQDFQLKSNSAAELHSGWLMFVNVQTLLNLSTVANGTIIQSVRRNYRLRLNR